MKRELSFDIITGIRYNILKGEVPLSHTENEAVKISMNNNFKHFFQKSGKTIYQISKQTGIPYTTLSELVNGKTDINKCSAGTVFRLSLFFCCSIEDILNKEPLIANVSGTYRNVKYKWKWDDSMSMVCLHIWDNGKEKIIDKDFYDQPRFYKSYVDMTETVIDYYLTQKQAEEMLNG